MYTMKMYMLAIFDNSHFLLVHIASPMECSPHIHMYMYIVYERVSASMASIHMYEFSCTYMYMYIVHLLFCTCTHIAHGVALHQWLYTCVYCSRAHVHTCTCIHSQFKYNLHCKYTTPSIHLEGLVGDVDLLYNTATLDDCEVIALGGSTAPVRLGVGQAGGGGSGNTRY